MTLMQYGCGFQALKRATFLAFLWGAFTFGCKSLYYRRGAWVEVSDVVDFIFSAAITLLCLLTHDHDVPRVVNAPFYVVVV
jgi:hypothetical protein